MDSGFSLREPRNDDRRMSSPGMTRGCFRRHCERQRSNPALACFLDCFVASAQNCFAILSRLPRNDAGSHGISFLHRRPVPGCCAARRFSRRDALLVRGPRARRWVPALRSGVGRCIASGTAGGAALLHRNMRHIHHPANEQWPFGGLLSKRCGEPSKSHREPRHRAHSRTKT